jgi:hypothetical protein
MCARRTPPAPLTSQFTRTLYDLIDCLQVGQQLFVIVAPYFVLCYELLVDVVQLIVVTFHGRPEQLVYE